jgi:hypothetical protein
MKTNAMSEVAQDCFTGAVTETMKKLSFLNCANSLRKLSSFTIKSENPCLLRLRAKTTPTRC